MRGTPPGGRAGESPDGLTAGVEQEGGGPRGLGGAWLWRHVTMQELSELLKRNRGAMNRVVLFVGSGMALKPHRKTNEDIAVEACVRYAESQGIELPEALPERQEAAYDAVDAAHLSPEALSELVAPLVEDLQVGEGHLRLARLTKERYFSTIFTMCFDDLLERALAQEHLLPVEQYNLVVVGKATRREITGALMESQRLTVVKLPGGAKDGPALTPRQVSSYLRRASHIMHELSKQCTLVVSYCARDRTLMPIIAREGDALWWINPQYPMSDRDAHDNLRIEQPDQLQHHAFQPEVVELLRSRRSERHVISREQGTFDGFFADLYDRRVRRGSDRHLEVRRTDLKMEPEGPFKFLDHYEAKDASIFFGRDDDTRRMRDLIDAHRVSVLFGRSGTGKTSLIHAGLVPPLEEEGALAITTRVLDEPATRITDELQRHPAVPEGLIREHKAPLAEVIRAVREETGRQVVIFLDQFEEFFARLGDRVRESFVQELAACLACEDLDTRWVVSIREDFFGELYELTESVPHILHAVYRLRRFAPSQARQAIVKPAAKFELKFEEALIERILEDLHTDEGIGPAQLQIVCYRLVEQLGPRRRGVKLKDYEVLGQAEGILKDHLNYVIQQFAWRERDAARTVLKELVRSMQMKAPLPIKKICSDLNIDRDRVERILWQLTDYRLVRRLGDEHERQYELVHEYLADEIHGWMTDEELEAKDAQDLMARELNDWREFEVLMRRESLKALHEHRTTLRTTAEELELILLSAAEQDFETDYWLPRSKELRHREVRFLRRILSSGRGKVRRYAVERLEALNTPEALDALLDALPQAAADEAAVIAGALEKRAGELVEAMSADDAHIRTRAAYALGQIGNEVAIRGLVDVLARGEPLAALRSAAVEGLRTTGFRAMARGQQAVTDALVASHRRKADDEATWLRAEALAGLVAGEASLRQLADAAEARGRVPQLRYALGRVFYDQKRLEEAREQLERLRADFPEVSDHEAVSRLARATGTLENELQEGRYRWAMFRKGPDHAAWTPETLSTNLVLRWSVRTDGQVVSSAAVDAGLVYSGSRDGRFRALHLRNGSVEWQVDVGARIESTPAVSGGRVVFGANDGGLYCHEARTGTPVWTYRAGGELRASPTICNGRVYVGSWDRHVHCVDLETGERVWATPTGAEVLASAAVAEYVYAPSWDGRLYALDPSTGAVVFEVPTEGELHSSPACADGCVVFGSDASSVYGVDALTGETRWVCDAGGPVRSSPAIVGGVAYVGGGDGVLRGLDLAGGEVVFEFRTGDGIQSSPAIAGSVLVVGSRDGGLYLVDRRTGESLWLAMTSYSVTASPAIADGHVVSAIDYYCIAAFGPGSVEETSGGGPLNLRQGARRADG